MAKDPAFLFYTSDFLTGTMFMTNEQVGLYIRMLCAQHQHGGRIDTTVLRTQCDSITGGILVYNKFVHDELGSYNERLQIEMDKRKLKSLKASESVRSRWNKVKANSAYEGNTNVLRTENENENRIDNTNLIYKTENLSILKEIGGVGERENFKDSQSAVSQNCLPKESDSEPPLQNTADSEPNQLPLEEEKEEKNHARVVHGGGDDEPKTPNTDSTPKTSRRLNDNLPSGIPLYLEDFEAYKTHLREFYVSFVNGEPKTIKFIDEMCNRYPNLDFQKTLTMNLVDYWATEEGYKTKLKAAKLAVKTNKGKDYHIDWFKTLATSFKYPTNRLYKQKDKPAKQEVSTSLPYGYMDLNAPVVRKQ